MKPLFALLSIGLLSLVGTAQEPPSTEQEPPTTSAAEAATDELEQMSMPVIKKRDTITLKSGVILTDVKIVGRTPRGYEISVADDVTMTIPRKQVADVEYGKKEDVAPPQEKGPFSGDSLPVDVIAKLAAPMAKPPAATPRDFLGVLEELSAACSVPIVVAEPVKAWPETERVWAVEVKPDMSVLGLLKEDFLAKFPTLDLSCKDNGLLVGLKQAAAAAPENTLAPPVEPAAPATQ